MTSLTPLQKDLQEIAEKRNMKPSTLQTYEKQMKLLVRKYYNKMDAVYENKSFLIEDCDKVCEYLHTLSNSTKKKTIATILVFLSPKKYNYIDTDSYTKYNDLLKIENKKYLESVAGNKKSEKDKEKWENWSDIMKVQKKLRKQYLADTNNHKLREDYIIVSLYTLLPPRRLEYCEIEPIQKNNFKNLTNLQKRTGMYYVYRTTKPYFYFGEKSCKVPTLNPVTIEIPSQLKQPLERLLTYRATDKNAHTLFTEDKNAFGKRIKNIFARFNMNMNCVMLRKIYLSDLKENKTYNESNEKMKELAEKMNHSQTVQQIIYTKKD
jgi:hypothetical protein